MKFIIGECPIRGGGDKLHEFAKRKQHHKQQKKERSEIENDPLSPITTNERCGQKQAHNMIQSSSLIGESSKPT